MLQSSFCTIAFQENRWGKDRTVETPVSEILPVLAEAGFDAAEIWAPHVREMSPPHLAETRLEMESLGLGASLISPYFDFTESSESAEMSLRLGRQCIGIATALGARGVRVFTGKVGSDQASQRQWDRAVSSLQALADQASQAGLFLACETHSRNLMDTPASAQRLVRLVDRPNVGLIFQPGTFGPEQCYDALDRLWPWTRHVHANNRRGDQRAWLSEGDIDYPRIFAKLRDVGFDGFISIEWMGGSPAEAARIEGAWLAEHLNP